MTFTYNSDGWTNWIEHPGDHVPPVEGYYIKAESKDMDGNLSYCEGLVTQAVLKSHGVHCFVHHKRRIGANVICMIILRYRVRRPDAAEALKALIADVPMEVV